MNPKVIKGAVPPWCAGSYGYGYGDGNGYGIGVGYGDGYGGNGHGAYIYHISLGSKDILCQESTDYRRSIQDYIECKKNPYYYWCSKCEEDPRAIMTIIGSVEL